MMPIALHLFLMVVSMFAAFFVGVILGLQWKDELGGAGWFAWLVFLASPIVGFVAPVLVFCLIPARCPGCRRPSAFLWPGETWIYRCLSCRHVHFTGWPGRENWHGPYRKTLRLPQLSLDESSQYRVTCSGRVHRPSTLVLRIWPVPPRDMESELLTQLDASVTDENGVTLIRAAGTVKPWESECVTFFARTDLVLRHSDWKDVPLNGRGNFTLELHLSEAAPKYRSLVIRPSLEFLQFSG